MGIQLVPHDAPKTTALEFHPLANLFPLIDGEEFDALKADVKAQGLRETIILFEGKILDGRNRYRACHATGVAGRFGQYTGNDPVGFVISMNLRRRHLSESQRAHVAAKLETMKRGRPGKDANLHVSREDAAQLLNVSSRSVASAAQVLEHGAPELQQAVERGEASVSAAADIATLSEAEQREIVAQGEKEIVQAANRIKRERKTKKREQRKADVAKLAASVSPAEERFTLYNEDCAAALEWEPGTVDLIITDPPYAEEHLALYDTLAGIAARVLRPGGSLLCMVGQSYLPQYYKALSALTYQWTLAYLLPGGQAVQVFPRKVNTFWKPVLWYVKGEYDGEWVGDVSRSAPNDNDKRFHEWGQSESGFRDLMSRFVRPGDVVLDPFMGAATTGVIALELGAQFFGFDIDRDAFNEALVRMGDAKLVA